MTIEKSLPQFQHLQAGGGRVVPEGENHWHLSLPTGGAKNYRLAQLDDYSRLARQSLLWRPPLTLELNARVSANGLPGTWGFGLWNDPFSVSLGLRGSGWRLPALPNCAWFFCASPANHLAFRSGHPTNGLLSAVFSAPRIPAGLLAPGWLLLPLALWPPSARLLRRLLGLIIIEDAQTCPHDQTQWHGYQIQWLANQVTFSIDGQVLWQTSYSPRPPLGFVLWIDNQFAAFPPDGKVKMGCQANSQPAWLEIEHIKVSSQLE